MAFSQGKPFWILLEQEMMGWQWHRLDHMQIICISLQTDNHASTSLPYLRGGWVLATQRWGHNRIGPIRICQYLTT